MANFGFDRLAVVDPYPPVWRETRAAPGAEDVVLNAGVFPNLAEAVADCHLVLGTTCGKNRAPDREAVPLPDIGKFLKKRAGKNSFNLTLVFGPEKTGLSNAHLELCHALLAVPTSARAPSMNLAQAAAVCCYELSKLADFSAAPLKKADSALPESGEIEAAARALGDALRESGIKDGKTPAMRLARLRGLLLKLPLSRRDLFYIRALSALPDRNRLLPNKIYDGAG